MLQSHRHGNASLPIKIAGLVSEEQFLECSWVPRERFRQKLPLDHTNASLFAVAAANEALHDAAWPPCKQVSTAHVANVSASCLQSGHACVALQSLTTH